MASGMWVIKIGIFLLEPFAEQFILGEGVSLKALASAEGRGSFAKPANCSPGEFPFPR